MEILRTRRDLICSALETIPGIKYVRPSAAFYVLANVEDLLRSEVNSELDFPPNFEGLVLGCIDADFCK